MCLTRTNVFDKLFLGKRFDIYGKIFKKIWGNLGIILSYYLWNFDVE